MTADRSDDFFKKLASGVPGVLYTYWLSADGKSHCCPYISEQARALFGMEPDWLRHNASPWFDLIHPEDLAGLNQSILSSWKAMTPWSHQVRFMRKDGEYEWFEGHSKPERQADGSTVWYGRFHSIQHYKVLEQSLRDSRAEFSFQAGFQRLIARLSTEFINLGFGTIDQCIDEVLSSIGRFFGVDRAYLYRFSDDYRQMTNTHEWCAPGVPSLMGEQQVVDISDFHWWRRRIRCMVEDNEVTFIENVDFLPLDAENEQSLLREQGVASMFCVPIRVRGRVTGFFGVDSLSLREWRTDQADLLIIVSGLLSGALERHYLEKELLAQSIRDPLTGLHNRRYLEPRLEELLARGGRQDESFAVVMLDIDHFKQLNDSLGHLGGDYVLQRFADLLRRYCRGSDIVCRFGGEEFLVVITPVNPDDVETLVARILDAVREETVVYNGQPIYVTVSAGVVCNSELPPANATSVALIDAADHRMYLAKKAGRDCVVDGSGLSGI